MPQMQDFATQQMSACADMAAGNLCSGRPTKVQMIATIILMHSAGGCFILPLRRVNF